MIRLRGRFLGFFNRALFSMTRLLRRNWTLRGDWAGVQSRDPEIKTGSFHFVHLRCGWVNALLMEAGGRLSNCDFGFLLFQLYIDFCLDKVVFRPPFLCHQDDFLLTDREQNLVCYFREVISHEHAAEIRLGGHRPLTHNKGVHMDAQTSCRRLSRKDRRCLAGVFELISI